MAISKKSFFYLKISNFCLCFYLHYAKIRPSMLRHISLEFIPYISIPLPKGKLMPVIARFYGLVIKMYFLQREHNPPHIHVLYGEFVGIISINNFEMIEGDLPQKALSLSQEWMKIYQADLLKIWETQDFRPLPPLE